MDRIKALEILGLNETATDNDIENKYSVLLKRNDQMKRETGEQDGGQFKAQTEAYAFLTGTEVYDWASGKREKLDSSNIWYYYKYFIIIVPIVVLFFGYLIADAFFRPKPDTSIMIAGQIYGISTKLLKEDIEKEVPEAGNIEANILSYKSGVNTPAMMTNKEKIFLELTMGKDDLVILDEELFFAYAKEGVFLKLDEIIDYNNNANADTDANSNSNKFLKVKAINDENEYIYGINISGNPIFNENDITGEKMILSVRNKGKFDESSIALVEYLTGLKIK